MIKKIKIKMMSKRGIEPTQTGLDTGIKIELVTCEETLCSTSRPLGSCEISEYKRSIILIVNGFISATQRFFKISENITKMPSWSKVSGWASIICSFGPPF